MQDVQSTNCVGSNYAGSARTEYEECNTEPCPVWTEWNLQSGAQCNASCGGGTINQSFICLNGSGAVVGTCNGKLKK